MISRPERLRFIEERIHSEWGWVDYRKPAPHENPAAYSYQDMQNAMRRVWGDDAPKTKMTVKRDIDILRTQHLNQGLTDEEQEAADNLLLPQNFPGFRRKLRGDHYETPRHQMASYYLIRALARREPLPQWVIDYFDEVDPERPFPDDINDLITQRERKGIMISVLLLVAPRHGKTDLVQDSIIQLYAEDPQIKVLYGNGTIKKTQSFISNYFMPVLEHHDWLVETYGPFKSDRYSWSKEGLILAGREGFHKSNSLHPFGIDGTVLSLDADLIVADDISDLKRARSETTTDNDADWLTTQLMTRREPHTAFLYVGSHVAVDTGDLFERVENKADELNTGDHVLIIKKVPAHRYDLCDIETDPNHEKCVLWHSLRPYSFLESMRALMGDDVMFEAVYNQIPRQRRQMHFPADILRAPYFYPDIPDGDTIRPVPKHTDKIGCLDYTRQFNHKVRCCNIIAPMVLGFDPAFSERKGAAFTAGVVQAGCTKCRRRYIVDFKQDRMSSAFHLDFIESFLQQYPDIALVVVEDNVAQKYLTQDPRTEQRLAKYRAYLKPWTTDERKHDPDMGIPQYGRHARSGMLSIPYETIYDREKAEEIIKTFIRWPQRPNDLVMAAWLSDLGIMELIEATQDVSDVMGPGAETWGTAAWEEELIEVDLSEVWDDGMEYM